MGVFVLGDLNVHSIRWLTHSARENAEGRLLRDISDQLEAEEKANCFLIAFESKKNMIDAEVNGYSEIPYVHPIFFCGLPTVEAKEKALASLDEDSALGPDLVPTRILKRCAKVSAPVVHVLILDILKFRKWSTIRMEHDVVP